MDDIIEELRARNEDVPVPLDLPTDEDLLSVEEQLFLPLPPEYREFLMQVGDVVLGALEPATAADPNAHNYLPELAATAWAEGLPRHLIPVCRHASGYYCMDPEGHVSLFEDGAFGEQEWESIWYWAQDVWLAGRTSPAAPRRPGAHSLSSQLTLPSSFSIYPYSTVAVRRGPHAGLSALGMLLPNQAKLPRQLSPELIWRNGPI